MTSTTSRLPRRRGSQGWTGLRARLETPTATYHLLVAVTTALVLFGLVMVLSASAVESLTESDARSPFSIFAKQLLFAGIGLVALLVAMRLKVRHWRMLAVPLWVISIGLQLLVFSPLGASALGNQNWIKVGPITIQPSELVKLGLVLTGALFLEKQRHRLAEVARVVVPYLVPIAALSCALVLAGSDLGTVVVMTAIVVGVLFVAGVPLRWFTAVGLVVSALAVGFVVSAPHRLQRLDVWLGRDTDPFGAARQPLHGRYALADGGWWGQGLGASREKWQLLSEPHNDFIFAIIGEELGLPGTLVILVLFALFAYVCVRIVTRAESDFVRIAAAGIMAWVLSQAMVNIGSVIGMLPVIGVGLPLVSSGGSSLITTMLAIGILLSFARAEPGCAQALQGGGSRLRRSAAVLPGLRRRGSVT